MVRSLYSRPALLLPLVLLLASTVFQSAHAQWTRVGSTFSDPRIEGQYAYVDGTVYVFGGSNGSIFHDCIALNTADPKEWITKNPMPFNRGGGYAAAYNGKIYLVGGVMDMDIGQNGLVLRFNTSVIEYDPEAQTYTPKTPIPYPTYNTPGAVVGSKIYLAGGRTRKASDTSAAEVSKRVQVYDMETDTWTTANDAPFQDFVPMLTAIGNELYYLGNKSPNKPYGYKGIIGDTITWEPIADCPKKLNGAAIGVMGGRVYVTGGNIANTNDKNTTTYSYDPSTNQWTELDSKLPQNSEMVPVMPGDGNSIYLVNGRGNFNTYRLSLTGTDVTETPAQQPALHLYPNPASGIAVVELPGNTLPAAISLLSVLGDEVLTQTTSGTQLVLNIRNLPAGMYTVRYTQGRSVLYRPLVIK